MQEFLQNFYTRLFARSLRSILEPDACLTLAGDEAQLELRGELMLAVGRLVKVLERDFLV